MKKKVTFYLYEDEYNHIKEQKGSMNEYVRRLIIDDMPPKKKDIQQGHTQNFELCKHGRRKDLCPKCS